MENKQDIIASARVHETDTGSPEVQVALLTARINHLNEHLKANKNDKPPRPAEDGWPPPQPSGLPAEEGHRALPRPDCEARPA